MISIDVVRFFIPRDEECLKVLEELGWRGELGCPYCSSNVIKYHGTYERGKIKIFRYQCKHCRSTFLALAGTVFEMRKLSLGVRFYIIKNLPHMSIDEIASELGLDYYSVNKLAMDVMEIAHGEVSLEKLCVVVEIDKIYVNSSEKGKKGFREKKSNGRGQEDLRIWQASSDNYS